MKFNTAIVAFGALAVANAECIADCEATAASSLGCDATDLAGCYCVAAFATAVKSCLYGDSACGSSYVSSFYSAYDATCADVDTTATTTTAAAAATSAAASCSIDICMASAAESLGCDVNDLAGCVCLDTFASAGKSCLYGGGCNSDVATFYGDINDLCADVSAASTTAAAATTAAAETTAAAAETTAAAAETTTAAAETTTAAAETTTAAEETTAAAPAASAATSAAGSSAAAAATTSAGSSAAAWTTTTAPSASGTGSYTTNGTYTIVTAGANANGAMGVAVAAVGVVAALL